MDNGLLTGEGYTALFQNGERRKLIVWAMRDGYVFGLCLGTNGKLTSAEALPGFRKYVREDA